MCGRFTLKTNLKVVAEAFGLGPDVLARYAALQPRYNVAPTQQVAAIRRNTERNVRELTLLQWGLIPAWADDPGIGNSMINARSETAAEKPAFREAFRRRRCLVPADGFYEWKRAGRSKQPYYIGLKDERPFAFAGLWETWRRGEQLIESCAILTTDANELLRPLHNRMPVILDPALVERWLDPDGDDPRALATLLRPYPSERMFAYEVSTKVNSTANDVAECVAPSSPEKRQGALFDL